MNNIIKIFGLAAFVFCFGSNSGAMSFTQDAPSACRLSFTISPLSIVGRDDLEKVIIRYCKDENCGEYEEKQIALSASEDGYSFKSECGDTDAKLFYLIMHSKSGGRYATEKLCRKCAGDYKIKINKNKAIEIMSYKEGSRAVIAEINNKYYARQYTLKDDIDRDLLQKAADSLPIYVKLWNKITVWLREKLNQTCGHKGIAGSNASPENYNGAEPLSPQTLASLAAEYMLLENFYFLEHPSAAEAQKSGYAAELLMKEYGLSPEEWKNFYTEASAKGLLKIPLIFDPMSASEKNMSIFLLDNWVWFD
ncbi:MAG: hypothetical protein LBL61_03905 [Elusimicrobiota bacterium]|nr:hypothetical protein [Elusimicrobiota bacterium]